MESVTIHLLKPGKGQTVTYQGEVIVWERGYALVLARWERPCMDLGYVVFEPGDRFYEHFYVERWFNIFELRSGSGDLKGWYCNITRPALFAGSVITSEDLELDLFVSPDRQQLLRLDMDEFERRGFAASEPETYAAALAALDELEQMAHTGEGPFDGAPDSRA